MKVFVPFSETLLELGLNLGELVPYQLEYPCLRRSRNPNHDCDEPGEPQPEHFLPLEA